MRALIATPDHGLIKKGKKMLIFTKYHGPTNSKGARISAQAPGWGVSRIYINYPYQKEGASAHAMAAAALLKKHNLLQADNEYQAEPTIGGYLFFRKSFHGHRFDLSVSD